MEQCKLTERDAVIALIGYEPTFKPTKDDIERYNQTGRKTWIEKGGTLVWDDTHILAENNITTKVHVNHDDIVRMMGLTYVNNETPYHLFDYECYERKIGDIDKPSNDLRKVEIDINAPFEEWEEEEYDSSRWHGCGNQYIISGMYMVYSSKVGKLQRHYLRGYSFRTAQAFYDFITNSEEYKPYLDLIFINK